MTLHETILWFSLLLSADFCAQIIGHLIKKFYKKALSNVQCEICDNPRKVSKTKDLKYKACRKCKKLYNESLIAETKKESA